MVFSIGGNIERPEKGRGRVHCTLVVQSQELSGGEHVIGSIRVADPKVIEFAHDDDE
jgi:hypothetical protein